MTSAEECVRGRGAGVKGLFINKTIDRGGASFTFDMQVSIDLLAELRRP